MIVSVLIKQRRRADRSHTAHRRDPLERDRYVDLPRVERRVKIDGHRVAEREVAGVYGQGVGHSGTANPLVASMRLTTSPILLFGVLAPAVMPIRTGPAGIQSARSTSLCLIAVGR